MCVRQLIPESVEFVFLVAAMTDVRRMPQVDCSPIAVAGNVTVHRAWEMETDVLDQSLVVELSTS